VFSKPISSHYPKIRLPIDQTVPFAHEAISQEYPCKFVTTCGICKDVFALILRQKLLSAWRSILTKFVEILSVEADTIRPDGDAVPFLSQLTEKDDLVPEQFLSFLSTDLAQHSERLQTIDSNLVQSIRSLVGGVDVDLNTALSPKQAPKP